MGDRIAFTIGSDNVFADLGLPEPDIRLVKAELTHRIDTLIDERRWTKTEAAQVLGIDQSDLSLLLRGRLSEFSLERLFRFLNALDYNVEITIRANPSPERAARVTMTAD